MATPRKKIIDHPSQTMQFVGGALTLDARNGIRLIPSAQTSNVAGKLYYDSTSNILRYSTATSWVDITLAADISEYADKNTPAHFGTGTFRPSSSGEYIYLSSNGTTGVWKQWSGDHFLDFRKNQIFTTNMNLTNNVRFATGIVMNNGQLLTVGAPVSAGDTTTKKYVDDARTLKTLLNQANAKVADMITVLNAEHNKLQTLWDDRKAFRNNGTTYPTDPAAANYWQGAGLKQAMIIVTRRMKDAGTI